MENNINPVEETVAPDLNAGRVEVDDNAADDVVVNNPVAPDGDAPHDVPPAAPDHPGRSDPDRPAEIARLVAEAEERGYLRGRNESIANLMEQPARVDPELKDIPSDSGTEVLILANIRPSVWD